MHASRQRVFLVDDHALVREWLCTLLQQEPDLTVCGQAESGPAALAGIAETRPELAIVDLTLKSGSGLDVIKNLRQISPATRIVVLSMHDEIHYVERAFRAGARGYVTKRDSTSAILEAVRAVLAGRMFARPEVMARLTERMVNVGAAGSDNAAAALSDREMEVFNRLGEGQPTRRIATEMGLSMKTVQAYHARIKDKLGLANATELMREAARWTSSNHPS